jgi:hypothetical protein
MDEATVVVGTGDDAMAFSVHRIDPTRWKYEISRNNGPILKTGDDLNGPADGDAVMAVKSLLLFARGTAQSIQHGGTDPHGFDKETIAAIIAVIDDISLAIAGGKSD